MMTKALAYPVTALIALALLVAVWPATRPAAQQASPAAVQIDNDDIGGVVTSKNGPEAGVWVIAETTELGTRFAKMAVTDDRGRYVIPDLPPATYNVWVRGYGLVDSPKVKSPRGQILNLTAVPAPNAKAAAEYYPAIYWFSMLKIPDKSLFPGTGPDGNGMPVAFKTQEQWLNAVQLNGCGNCHQLGDKATREFPAALEVAGRSSVDAWTRRLQSGPGGGTAAGSSPALMRSVQAARRARCPPSGMVRVVMVLIMLVLAGPDCRRRAHASCELANVPRAAGISRVALSPSW